MLTDLCEISHEGGPLFVMVSWALKHHHRGHTKLFFFADQENFQYSQWWKNSGENLRAGRMWVKCDCRLVNCSHEHELLSQRNLTAGSYGKTVQIYCRFFCPRYRCFCAARLTCKPVRESRSSWGGSRIAGCHRAGAGGCERCLPDADETYAADFFYFIFVSRGFWPHSPDGFGPSSFNHVSF